MVATQIKGKSVYVHHLLTPHTVLYHVPLSSGGVQRSGPVPMESPRHSHHAGSTAGAPPDAAGGAAATHRAGLWLGSCRWTTRHTRLAPIHACKVSWVDEHVGAMSASCWGHVGVMLRSSAHPQTLPPTVYELELKVACQAALQAGWPEDYSTAYKGTAPSCTITGLRAGCAYSARVRAANAACCWSQPLEACTAPDTPDEPDAPWMCGSSAATLQLAWQPPVHDGGQPLEAYRVQLRCRGASGEAMIVFDGLDTHCTVVDLLPGVDYEFRLQAVNAQGASAWSCWGLGATRPAPPPAPVLLPSGCTAASTQAQLAWDVGDDSAVPGTHFQVQLAAPGGHPSRATSSTDVRMLGSDGSLGDAGSSVSDSSGDQLQPATPPNGPPGPPVVQLPASRSPSRHSISEEEGGLLFTTAYHGRERHCTLTG